MVAPMLAGVAVLLLLGLHPPTALSDLLTHAAAQLQGAS
jgi:hydrogenase-4 component F